MRAAVRAAHAVEQIVGGAAAPDDIAVEERADGVHDPGGGAQPGQGLQRRGEADEGGLVQFRVGQSVAGRVDPQRIVRRGQPWVRSASGFTARYAVSAASGSSKSAVVTASGTIQPSSPGCASIMRSSRWPRGLTGGNSVETW